MQILGDGERGEMIKMKKKGSEEKKRKRTLEHWRLTVNHQPSAVGLVWSVLCRRASVKSIALLASCGCLYLQDKIQDTTYYSVQIQGPQSTG